MADTATTRPARGSRRTATKAAPAAKAAKPAATPAPEVEATEAADGNVRRLVLALEHVGDTKSYSTWKPADSSGCVGKLYAPLGATEVRVAIIGGDE